MKVHSLHDWDLEPRAAVALQKELAAQLISDRPLDLRKIDTVAGVDVSVKDGMSQAAVVVMSYPGLETLEAARASRRTAYPYIPGLLSFREGPALEEAFRRLTIEPDVFIFDGMGQIHPRRMGIAAHLGLWLRRPTVGCGKTHLIGDYEEPAKAKGSWSVLTHRGERLGAVLRTRANVKPVYVSVGHLADLGTAIELVLACTPKYRLPRPIRQAHAAAGEHEKRWR